MIKVQQRLSPDASTELLMLDGGSLLFAVEKHLEVGLAVPSLRRACRLRSWAGRLVYIDRIGTLMLHEAHGEIGLGVGLVSECYP